MRRDDHDWRELGHTWRRAWRGAAFFVTALVIALGSGAVFAGCGEESGADCTLHCENGAQDCGEEGIDCGGDCDTCVDPCEGHCGNGVQDCGEEGFDCGGECDACSPNNASFVSQNVPATAMPGSTFPVEITMRNEGTTTWTPEQPNPYRFGSWNPMDNQTWGLGRVELGAGTAVAPGETYTFSFTATAPVGEGDYDLQWRLVQEAVEWFGEPSENLTITVEGWPEYDTNPYVFSVAEPVPGWSAGGLFVHDLDGDGLLDFVVTSSTHVAAYDHFGVGLWSEPVGIKTSGEYPGAHHPGAIAGDMDGDGEQEVAYLTEGDVLRILDGVSGVEEGTHSFPGAQGVAIANLRGLGDRDAILQYSQTELRAVRLDTGAELWHTTEYICTEHIMARQADLDGDGLDEVAGLTFIDHDGTLMSQWDLAADRGTNLWSVDSIVIADVIPGGPLEVVVAEQGGNNEAIAMSHQQVLFGTNNPDNPCCAVAGECLERDCDKVAVGDFLPASAGLEIFCRSACGRAPWLIDATGQIVSQWVVDDTKPAGWNTDGIEEVVGLDWDGDDQREIVVTERHTDGNGAIVNAATGEFRVTFGAQAARIYAVDLAGDPREEVVIWDLTGEIRIYWNEDPSAGASTVRPWTLAHYRRQKQNWGYYAP